MSQMTTNELLNLFKPVNPTYERLFKNKTERESIERLIKKFGEEKVENMIKYLSRVKGKPYCPVITTPYQLERKLGQLIQYKNQKQLIKEPGDNIPEYKTLSGSWDRKKPTKGLEDLKKKMQEIVK